MLRQKLKYFGRLKRHDGMGKIILEGRVNGKRKRVRHRGQWKKSIEGVLKMSIIEAGRLASKRDEFRIGVRAPCPLQDKRIRRRPKVQVYMDLLRFPSMSMRKTLELINACKKVLESFDTQIVKKLRKFQISC